MKVLDLFSGIGGFSLGLESTGLYHTVGFCEIDPFCRKVLRKHWPDLPIHEDICHVSGYAYRGIDVVTGGFPCQPVSLAGKRKGKKDARWLWPELFRVIREARPRWCIIENVPGLRTKHADEVLADLEEQGYSSWPLVVGAGSAGAPHQRERVWVVAHTHRPGLAQWQSQRGNTCPQQQAIERGNGRQLISEWSWERAPEPVLGRMVHGLPCGMDRRERITVLGNSVVPQVVAAIGRTIAWRELVRGPGVSSTGEG